MHILVWAIVACMCDVSTNVYELIQVYYGIVDTVFTGDTFEDTICTDANKVSIIEDKAFNLVDTAVHELGHA